MKMMPKTNFFHFQTQGLARVTIPPDNGPRPESFAANTGEGSSTTAQSHVGVAQESQVAVLVHFFSKMHM